MLHSPRQQSTVNPPVMEGETNPKLAKLYVELTNQIGELLYNEIPVQQVFLATLKSLKLAYELGKLECKT